MHARGIGHVLVDDFADAVGGMDRREAERLADVALERASAASTSSANLPPAKRARIDPAEHEIGVGDGRRRAAAAVARGPGSAPALSGPTLRRSSWSTRAIEPPPAPISTISITGMRTGRPLP